MTFCFEMVYREAFGNTGTDYEILPDFPVTMLVFHNVHVPQVGTATVSEAGATSETEAVRGPHNQDLPPQQGTDLILLVL